VARPTKAIKQEIDEAEGDLTTLSIINEAARILAMRIREEANLKEVKIIRQGIAAIKARAVARRERIRTRQ
jgi:hypothetical protein